MALADDRHRLARAANGFHLPAATFTELQFGIGEVKMIAPTMKARALVRWRRKAVAAKRLATSFQTPFAKRRMVQVVATYKVLAKRAARRQRAERRLGFTARLSMPDLP